MKFWMVFLTFSSVLTLSVPCGQPPAALCLVEAFTSPLQHHVVYVQDMYCGILFATFDVLQKKAPKEYAGCTGKLRNRPLCDLFSLLQLAKFLFFLSFVFLTLLMLISQAPGRVPPPFRLAPHSQPLFPPSYSSIAASFLHHV